jgi:hypothetical protein
MSAMARSIRAIGDVHTRRVSRVGQRAGIWIVSDRPPAVAVNVTGWPLTWSLQWDRFVEKSQNGTLTSF